MRATNATGTTYADDVPFDFSFTTVGPAGAFNKVTPANPTAGVSVTPTLTWTASSGVTTYDYCISTSSSSCAGTAPLGTWTTAGTNTTATFGSSLGGFTTYYWQVRANGSPAAFADGGSLTTGYWSFTTGASAPAAFTKSTTPPTPQNNATGVTLPVSLNWSAATGATSYDLCLTTGANCNSGPWITLGNVTTKSLSGLTIQAAKKYQWQIRATNAIGTTYADNGTAVAPGSWNFTTAATATYPGSFKKSMPTDGLTGLGTSVALSWTASTNATGYSYCYTTTANGCSDTLGSWSASTTNLSVLITGLSANTKYYWQVKATNAVPGTTYADDVPIYDFSFTTAAAGFLKTQPTNNNNAVCDDPAGVCSGPSNPTRLSYMIWDADPSATGSTHYFYCVSTATFTGAACLGTGGTGTVTPWVDAGAGVLHSPLLSLAKGTSFFWQVRWSSDGGTTWNYADGGTVYTFKTKG